MSQSLLSQRIKVAVISTSVPPAPSGQARVLGHLLKGAPLDDCLLMSDQLGFLTQVNPDQYVGRYRSLAQPQFTISSRIGGYLPPAFKEYVGLTISVFRRAREIQKALAEMRPHAVIACSGNPFDLPAAFLAGLWTRLPLIVYMFDDPVFQWPAGRYRTMARFWEALWVRRAVGIVAPNELLAEDLNKRHSAAVTIIRNPVEDYQLPDEPVAQTYSPHSPRHIVYTGSVYHAQGDAFRNLVVAMDGMEGRFHLHVYTSQPQSALDEQGLIGPNVTRHDHVGGAEVTHVQRNADILFLPLAFHSTIQEVVRTSAPAKLGEYLASGSPILVHAPHNSFVSQYCSRQQAAAVVDQPDPQSLARALDRIAGDAELRKRMRERARVAAAEFHVDRSRETFWSLVERISKGT